MNVELVRIDTRQQRIEWACHRFKQYFQGKLLDVGCDEAHLKTKLSHLEYTGIDISGKPDHYIDLDQNPKLPFESHSYDVVFCSDVLEHIDTLHEVFVEMVRVSKKYIIVALPNNWANARVPLSRGRGKIGHYGLPAQRPVDRHKWFFSLEEASDFYLAKADEYNLTVVEIFAIEKPKSWVKRKLRYAFSRTQMSYLNKYAHSLWVVYQNNHAS